MHALRALNARLVAIHLQEILIIFCSDVIFVRDHEKYSFGSSIK